MVNLFLDFMKKEVKNLVELEKILNQTNFFEALGIDKIGVFGSFARGEKANDLDLLLDKVNDFVKLISIKEELEEKIGKKIDLVIDKYANPIILHRAKKDLVYVKKYKD